MATVNYDPKNVKAIHADLRKIGEATCLVIQMYNKLYVERDFCAALISVMKMHAMNNAMIAQTSLRLVGLFVKCCVTARCRMIAAGICPVMIDILKHLGSKNRDVAMWSCGTLTLLLRERNAQGNGAHFVINQRVFDPTVCKVLIAALRTHGLHVDTTTWVPAIAALCYDNTDVNRKEFQKLGVGEMLRGLTKGCGSGIAGVCDDCDPNQVMRVPFSEWVEYALEVADMLL